MAQRQPNKSGRLLSPRWIGYWAVIALLRLMVLLPLGWLVAIGKALGLVLYLLMGHRRRIALRNIAACFPELTARQCKDRCLAHFQSLGIAVFEVGLTWWASDRQLASITTISGTEHLRAALQQGHGVILLSAHFTPLELSCRVLAQSFRIDCMYRPNNNPFIDAMLFKGRQRWAHRVIPRNDVRGMLKSLKENDIVWYAPDQGLTGPNSVLARFFSIPAWTTTATSRLAGASDAVVLPFAFRRRTDAAGYIAEIGQAFEQFPGDNPVADAERIHAVFESQIRAAPEQYLWIHRRFKNLPAPHDRFYEASMQHQKTN